MNLLVDPTLVPTWLKGTASVAPKLTINRRSS